MVREDGAEGVKLDDLISHDALYLFDIRIWLATEADVDDVVQDIQRRAEDEARSHLGLPPRRRVRQ